MNKEEINEKYMESNLDKKIAWGINQIYLKAKENEKIKDSKILNMDNIDLIDFNNFIRINSRKNGEEGFYAGYFKIQDSSITVDFIDSEHTIRLTKKIDNIVEFTVVFSKKYRVSTIEDLRRPKHEISNVLTGFNIDGKEGDIGILIETDHKNKTSKVFRIKEQYNIVPI